MVLAMRGLQYLRCARPRCRSLSHDVASRLARLAEELRPSEQQLERVEEMKQKLQTVSTNLGATLQCYGSCSNGTFMEGSDMDFSLMVDERQILAAFSKGVRGSEQKLNPPPPPGPPPPPPESPRNPRVPTALRPEAPPRQVPAPPPAPNLSSQDLQALHLKVLRFLRIKSRHLLQTKRSGKSGNAEETVSPRCAIERTVLVNARVPVLQFQVKKNVVLCDVSVNNKEGLINTLLVRRFCEAEPLLPPLVRLLKHWARCRNLAERRTDGFSTYTLILMAVHVLQMGETALNQQMVHQLREEIGKNSVDRCESLEVWCPSDSPLPLTEVAKAFAKFFEIFAQAAFQSGATICIDSVDASTAYDQSGILRILCPLTQKDVQRCQPKDWTLMFDEISRAAEVLRNETDLEVLFQARKPKTSTQVPPPPPTAEAGALGVTAVLRPPAVTEASPRHHMRAEP